MAQRLDPNLGDASNPYQSEDGMSNDHWTVSSSLYPSDM